MLRGSERLIEHKQRTIWLDWLNRISNILRAKSRRMGHIMLRKVLEDYRSLQISEFLNAKPSLTDDSTESTFRNIPAWMVRHYSVSVRRGIIPDFVAALSVSIKDKASFAKFINYFRRFKRRKAAHFSTGTGISTSNLKWGFSPLVRFFGSGSPFSMQDSIILRATSSAISIVSAIVLPWATKPCRTELVARYSPSSKYSIDIGIRYSDINLLPPIRSITQGAKGVKQDG